MQTYVRTPTFLFKITFADGYKTTVRAESAFFAIWDVDEDTKKHGIVVHMK